jgi:hypothetical protein
LLYSPETEYFESARSKMRAPSSSTDVGTGAAQKILQ